MSFRSNIFAQKAATPGLPEASDPYLYIGNGAGTFPTALSLANKLGILESDISEFYIKGTAVKAKVDVNYNISGWDSYTTIKAFREFTDRVEIIGYTSFYGSGYKFVGIESTAITINSQAFQTVNSTSDKNKTTLGKIYLPKATSCEYAAFYGVGGRIYVPEMLTFGTSNFTAIAWGKCTIYAHPSLATSNSGAMHPDLLYAKNSKGATIIFVQNYNKPNQITDLSYSVSGTDVTINFTAASSSNGIDFYEVYVNGIYTKVITGTATTLSGLSNGDTIEVFACDIYFNRSQSNEITVTI